MPTVGREETERLRTVLERNCVVKQILRRTPKLRMPNWYLGAGCVAQTVWNVFHEYDPARNIQDYDLVYFDSTNLTEEGEEGYAQKVLSTLGDLGVTIDVKNQARVHLWYEREFGYPIAPYVSVEDAIGSWPTTATSVGIRYEENGKFVVWAPFGLSDLFSMIVRPNKKQVNREVYNKKAERWLMAWPKLIVVAWEHG